MNSNASKRRSGKTQSKRKRTVSQRDSIAHQAKKAAGVAEKGPLSLTQEGVIVINPTEHEKQKARETAKKLKASRNEKAIKKEEEEPDMLVEEERAESPIPDAIHLESDLEIDLSIAQHRRDDGTESRDFVSTALDEVALEGLEGITLETLWLRISIALNHTYVISRELQKLIWDVVKSQTELEFFHLPSPRNKVTMQQLESNLINAANIYSFVPVNDTENGIMGSCSSYDTRTLIDRSTLQSLEEAENTYGNSLVIVASQKLRIRSLTHEKCDPLLTFNDHQYYILEMVGRSRFTGIATAGPDSLCNVIKDSKTLFYRRVSLQKKNLVMKQMCRVRCDAERFVTANLVHLTRFFYTRKSFRQMLITHIADLLRKAPNYRMEYHELKRLLNSDMWDKYNFVKLFKSAEFKQLFNSDHHVLYRELYPNASRDEWKRKKTPNEKILKVVELKNPNFNVNSIFRTEDEPNETIDCDSSEDEMDFADDCYSECTIKEKIYRVIHESGNNGVELRRICRLTCTDFFTIRTVCRTMQRSGIIKAVIEAAGKVHLLRYVVDNSASTTAEQVQDAKQKKRKKNEAKKPKIEVVDDDETLDFIANTLNVDVECLKGSRPNEPVVEEAKAPTIYNTIIDLKNSKNFDKLSEIYKNTEPFSSQGIKHEKPPHFNPNACDFFKKGFSYCPLENPNLSPVYSNKTHENTIDYLKIENFEDEVSKILDKKNAILDKDNIFSIIPKNLIDSQYTGETHETYIRALYQLDEKNYQLSESSSDCPEEPLEDIQSNETLLSGLDVPYRENVDDEVKRKICENFENVDGLRALFETNVSTEIPENIEVNENGQEVNETDTKFTPHLYYGAYLEPFMGSEPKILCSSTDNHNIDYMVILSSNPELLAEKPDLVTNTSVYRSRIQLMNDAVRKENHAVDLYRIYKTVRDSEKEQGIKVEMARRTFAKLLYQLVRNGTIRIAKIILRFENTVRSKNCAIPPNADPLATIQSNLDQFKLGFLIFAKRKNFEEQNNCPNTTLAFQRRKRYRYSKNIGKIYGYHPKISKMRALHDFLFYLIRGYDGCAIDDSEKRVVFERNCDVVDEQLLEESTTVYQRETSWKMFVSPLPRHSQYPEGWALISDILMRLPISLFVKLFNIPCIVPEFPSYLNHPIKKYFLVMNLPSDIKDGLMGYRKHIGCIYEVHTNLAYLGLLQFGPQNVFDKPNVFIYLNKNALLYDTTTSDAGYHLISSDKEYAKKAYTFNTCADIETYWSDMYFICMSTKLGRRNAVLGTSIKLELAHCKDILQTALDAQSAESAAERDVGYVPGDRLGACCFDSSLWMHLCRNWVWSTKKTNASRVASTRITGEMRRKRLENIKPGSGILSKNASSSGRSKLSSKYPTHFLMKRLKISKTSSGTTAKVKGRSKKAVVFRKVKPRKQMATRKSSMANRPIAVERTARKTRRFIFNAAEDHVLQIVIAVWNYIFKYSKDRPVFYMVIRDLLHRLVPSSRKTRGGYKRRIIQLRQVNVLNDDREIVDFKLESDFFVQKHFKSVQEKIKNGLFLPETILAKIFLHFVFYLFTKYKSASDPALASLAYNRQEVKDYLVPNLISKMNLSPSEKSSIYKNPKTEQEIVFDTAMSVIHSSLSIQNAGEEWPMQLLKVYQCFSENVLRDALHFMQKNRIIAGRKIKMSEAREGALQMKGRTYNLSSVYTYKLITAFPICVFTQSDHLLVSLFGPNKSTHIARDGLSIDRLDQDHCLGLNDVSSLTKVHYTFDLPEDLIMLNPKIKDVGPLVRELTKRYTALIRKGQDNEDQSVGEKIDTDVLVNLETSLEMFIKSQSSQNEAMEALGAKLEALYEQEDSSSNVLNEEHSIKDEGTKKRGLRIVDLAFMLTKGLFPELDDDEKLEKLNKYFVVQYPTCKLFLDVDQVDIYNNCRGNFEEFTLWMENYINRTYKLANMLPTLKDESNTILANEIIDYIIKRSHLGATSKELKEHFPKSDLHVILEELIDTGIIIRAGVCNFAFVHYIYRHSWSISLKAEGIPPESLGCRIRICPWIKVDGTVHELFLEACMYSVLSYCLSYPLVTFLKLCSRFNTFKPVDLYCILEILEKLSCVKLWCYMMDNYEEEDFFSEPRCISQVRGTLLDNFDDLFVETDCLAITKFGAFLNRKRTDFTNVFVEP